MLRYGLSVTDLTYNYRQQLTTLNVNNDTAKASQCMLRSITVDTYATHSSVALLSAVRITAEAHANQLSYLRLQNTTIIGSIVIRRTVVKQRIVDIKAHL